MKHGKILNIGPPADSDPMDISPNDNVKPHTAFFSDLNIPDDRTTVRKKHSPVDPGMNPAIWQDGDAIHSDARGGDQPGRFHPVSSTLMLPRITFNLAVTGIRASSLLNHPSKPPVNPKTPTNPA